MRLLAGTFLAFVCSLSLASALSEPTDPLYQDQTNLHKVGVDAIGAWQTTMGKGAVICVLDSGVDWHHREMRTQYFIHRGEIPAWILSGTDNVLDIDDFAGIPTAAVDHNGNGFLDIGDILITFSNGIDNDGNGFVDDISGWDFDDDDNDAYDLWHNSHGMGRAGMLANAIDGFGSVGLAPESKIMGIRVGDSILHTADTLALGVAYCADNGADSINMSLGAAGSSTFLRDAFRYAAELGVVSAGAAGNEAHYHHEFNASFDDVISSGSVIEDPTSEGMWTEKANSTVYGAKLSLSGGTFTWTADPFTGDGNRQEGGTSSATPHIAAGAALVRQAGRLQGLNLSNDEVKQILTATAVDLKGTKWNAAAGWDPYTGYGRINYAKAVEAVNLGRIPPEANLQRPLWYEVLTPELNPTLQVSGRVSSRSGNSLALTLEWGTGVTPTTWTPIVSKRQVKGPLNGDLMLGETVPLADLKTMVAPSMSELLNPQSHAITLRLTVVDTGTNLKAEDRQAFFVLSDPELRPGFPKQNTASVESPILAADLDGDGSQEVVVCDSDGRIKVYRRDGTILWQAHTDGYVTHPGAPVFKDAVLQPGYEPILASPAAADLDGDGTLELVVPGLLGHVYAFKADGTRFWAAPVTTDLSRYPGEQQTRSRLYSSIVLFDIDADGVPEVIAGAQDQQIYVWRADGSRMPGFPFFVSSKHTPADVVSGAYRPAPIGSAPAVGDINGDGQIDFALGTNQIDRNFFGHVYAIDGRGTKAPKPILWESITIVSPYGLPVVGEGVSGGVALYDLDGDGKLEVIGGGFSGNGAIWNHDGSLRLLLERNRAQFGAYSDSNEPLIVGWTDAQPTIGYFSTDGRPNILGAGLGLGGLVMMSGPGEAVAGSPIPDINHIVTAWTPDGKSLPYFPKRIEGWAILTNPLLADVDGDSLPEMVVGSSGYYLHAFKPDGREPKGWPKFTGGWVFSTPVAVDLDGDGTTSVVTAVREGQLFAWKTKGRINTSSPWLQYRADAARTGIPPKASVATTAITDAGCGCSTTGDGSMGAVWVFLAGLWVVLRWRGSNKVR